MIKSNLVKKEIIEDIIEDILCNKCGKSLKDEQGMNYEGLVEANFIGGFYSKFGDMSKYKFSLCEECLDELFKSFKHDPYVPDYE